jgi:hypothetical protein
MKVPDLFGNWGDDALGIIIMPPSKKPTDTVRNGEFLSLVTSTRHPDTIS